MQILRTIRLYGRLGQKFGREFRLAVNSPAEAVRALQSQLPGFRQELLRSDERGVGYIVRIGDEKLTMDDLHNPPGNEVIKIAPVMMGSGGNNGLGTIILGAVLLVAGFFTGGAGWAAAAGTLKMGLLQMGAAFMLSGVSQMLAPTPKGLAGDKDANKASYVMNGAVNTQAQGNPVPLQYGRLIRGSALASASIEARDNALVPTGSNNAAPPSDTSTRMGGGSPLWHLDWVENTHSEQER